MSSSSEKKRAAVTEKKDHDAGHTTKKTCIRSAVEPDVVVVVGGVEFQEYSPILCLWSGYFEAAFRSGMKDARSKRFEFPDRDPKEWEMVRAFVAPYQKECPITKNNVFTLLPWFDELCCTHGSKACDQFLARWISWRERKKTEIEFYDLVIDAMKACGKYSLPLTKSSGLESFKWMIGKWPEWLFKDDQRLENLLCKY